MSSTIRCYQCEQKVNYLFADSRCKDCTRLTPAEVRGDFVYCSYCSDFGCHKCDSTQPNLS